MRWTALSCAAQHLKPPREAIATASSPWCLPRIAQPCWRFRDSGRPTHKVVPDSAKKTRSIAAIRMVARKNRCDEGSR